MKTFKSALFAASMVLCLGGASAFAGSAQATAPETMETAAVQSVSTDSSKIPPVVNRCDMTAFNSCMASSTGGPNAIQACKRASGCDKNVN
jgi:hypothetical protein